MNVILVEVPGALDAVAPRLVPCLRVRFVKWLHSYVETDRALCVFEAVDAETVRNAFRSAGVEFTRAWRSEWRPFTND